MANSRRIVIEFLGKDVSAGKVAQQVESKTSSFGSKIGKVAKVGALATAGLGAGVLALAKSSSDLEQKFSRTMSLVAASTGAPKSAIADLNDLAMKMGAETAFSANEAADAMLELGKAGISTSDIMGGALKGTLLLATAGQTDLATASTIASNAMNTFNLRGKDMNSIAAALAGGANASSASVESLGQALQQVGPGATNAGLSLQQTVGVLSAFDAAGVKGSDAGTSLKTMLARLVPQTDKAATAMQRYNLHFVDAEGNFKSITNIAQQLKEGLGGLSEAQRTQALTTIFGSDASRAATVLMKEGAEGLAKYIKATKDQGAAQKMADASMSGSAGAMERLSGAVETAKLAFGQALAPVVIWLANVLSTKVLPAFTRVISVFQGGGEGAQRFKAGLQVAGQWVQTVAHWVRDELVPFLIDLKDRFVDAMGGTEGFKKVLKDLQPWLKAVKTYLGDLWAIMKWGLRTVIPVLVLAIKALAKSMNIIGTTALKVRTAVREAFTNVRTTIRNAADTVVGAVKAIPGRLRDLGKNFRDAGAHIIGRFVDGIKNAGGIISGIAGNVWSAVKKLLNKAIDKINSSLAFTISLPGPDINVNPPDIPHLARGGIVKARTGGTLALIGEGGRDEAVIPLPRRGELARGTSMAGGDFTVSAPLVLQLDSGVIWKGLLKVKRQRGGLSLGLA